MMLLRRALFCIPMFLMAADGEASIQKLLDDQVAAWNSGDVTTFVSFYSPDCVYIGKNVAHGRDEVLANYRKRYADRAAMGKLRFSGVKINRLETHTAMAVGHFQLDRTTAGGGPASGTFSLVFVERNGKWMILLDHTS